MGGQLGDNPQSLLSVPTQIFMRGTSLSLTTKLPVEQETPPNANALPAPVNFNFSQLQF
jgi:hypothetical protein